MYNNITVVECQRLIALSSNNMDCNSLRGSATTSPPLPPPLSPPPPPPLPLPLPPPPPPPPPPPSPSPSPTLLSAHRPSNICKEAPP
ncbi:hypothetical protein WN51_01490 [Melipona quadrifasciata]|uniref:Uncharacterized protein n=1 Tax=Melipona quadrifasciata TaxID=166423 RepID=A0A0N0BF08_9HYME|nr:hypothetical protein WN51_01490 [Melipona quadrifasciata]